MTKQRLAESYKLQQHISKSVILNYTKKKEALSYKEKREKYYFLKQRIGTVWKLSILIQDILPYI